VTQAAFKGFTEEGINPGFVTLRQLTSKGRQCIGDNRLNNRGDVGDACTERSQVKHGNAVRRHWLQAKTKC